MNKLHLDAGPEKPSEKTEKGGDGLKRGAFSKWLLAPGCAAALALSLHACGDMNVDVPVPQIPPQQQDGGATDSGTDHDTGPDADAGVDGGSDGGSDAGTDADAGCEPLPPVCTPQTVSALIHGGGAPLVVGDFRIALEITYEEGGEQLAVVDLNDVCDVPVVNDQVIAENATVTMVAVPGSIEVDAKAEQVTIGDQSARITATMRCPGEETDGGVSDGGTDAGPDVDAGSDAGPDTDAGVDAGPDVDAGADAGPDVDAGTDAGPDVDGGTDGGVTDGGVTDGGTTDAGPVACVDAGVGAFVGNISTGSPHVVGGYVFEYLGKIGSNTMFRISCGGSVVEDTITCPAGVNTELVIASDGRTISIYPNSAGSSIVNVSINVAVTP